ncbi:hypothetical protein BRC60_07415 [Halobacteriales archaeon QH_1_68_42]|nr:MAG: hypothetical protein BRC60_07415 [Halobacteriales archaeon QH_1_68_42]
MLAEALSYPRDDEDPTRPFLVGSLILFSSFILGLTIIPLYGYLLEVLDRGRTGQRGLPEFGDWETLIMDGLKVFVVNLIYTGIPTIVLSVVGGLGFFLFLIGGITLQNGNGGGGGVFLLILLVVGLLSLVAFVLLLVATLMLPAALARMRVEDDLRAALQVREVFEVAKNGEYIVAVLLAFVVGFGFSLVGGLLLIVLIGIPILLYGFMIVFHLYGQGYARAVEEMERNSPGSTSGSD